MDALDRRTFLKGLAGAGAFVLGARFGDLRTAHAATDTPWQPSLWLAIGEDGAVTLWTHRSEMGTGIRTSLPMVVADELEADWSRVTLAQAAGDARYGSQNTDGSRSVRRFFDTMRQAGAAVRHMLEQAAAQTWGVPAAQCTAREHGVDGPGGKRLGFGELVAAARTLKVPEVGALKFKPKAARRYVGKETVRLYDLDDMITGRARYGADVRLDGMQTAVIWRVPVLGGTITSFDATAAKAVAGVTDVVQIPAWQGAPAFQALGGVAVVAENTWAALEGRRRLKVEWKPGPHGAFDSTAYLDALAETSRKPGRAVRSAGDVDAALKAAPRKVVADYRVPFLAHAPMEPPCAVARVSAGRCEAWAPTQNPQAAQAELARALKLKPEDVVVNVTLLGGGFGRKSKPDFVAEAALLSQQLKRPIRVMWTREDDVRHGYYHAAAAVHVEAGLDAAGMPQAWLQRSTFPPIPSTFNPAAREGSAGELHLGFTDLPYPVPNLRCEVGQAQAHVRIGWLRSVCHIFHAFAECSFVDELAHAANKPPLEYLRALIGPPRHVDMTGVDYKNHDEPLKTYPIDTGRLRGVLDRAAAAAGTAGGPSATKGEGWGLAAHRSFLSYVGLAVQARVSKAGVVSIPRVEVVLDCGLIVNPDRVRAQMEGACVFGASLALMGAITAKDGRIEQSNFHDYPVARMNEAPRVINVHLVDSDAPPGGVGEPGVPPFAPALCNAIFAAVGKRIRALPLSRHDLSWS